ncbi:hypothetical protein MMC06_001249 [Schaereria dolodes]|nr:hypothetical protein [Schaereria dolodes]
MPTIAISGAGSGIGYSFTQHFASHPNTTIHAIDRSFPDASHPTAPPTAKIIYHTIDVSSASSIASLSTSLGKTPINLFIHSAAVRGLVPSELEKDDNPAPAETLEAMDSETMLKTLSINVVGTFLLIRALLPNLRLAASTLPPTAKVIIMGSRMGSIASNASGSAYAYRASKAGLNALVKSFSLDVPEVCFVVMHPGRVESRMVPTMREEGAIDAHEAVAMMVPLIDGFGEADSGRFVGREGDEIPW